MQKTIIKLIYISLFSILTLSFVWASSAVEEKILPPPKSLTEEFLTDQRVFDLLGKIKYVKEIVKGPSIERLSSKKINEMKELLFKTRNHRKDEMRQIFKTIYDPPESTNAHYSQNSDINEKYYLYQIFKNDEIGKIDSDCDKIGICSTLQPLPLERLVYEKGWNQGAYPIPEGKGAFSILLLSEFIKDFNTDFVSLLINSLLHNSKNQTTTEEHKDLFQLEKDLMQKWIEYSNLVSKEQLISEMLPLMSEGSILAWNSFCLLREFFIGQYISSDQLYEPSLLVAPCFFYLGLISKEGYSQYHTKATVNELNKSLTIDSVKRDYIYFKMKEHFLRKLVNTLSNVPTANYATRIVSYVTPGYSLKIRPTLSFQASKSYKTPLLFTLDISMIKEKSDVKQNPRITFKAKKKKIEEKKHSLEEQKALEEDAKKALTALLAEEEREKKEIEHKRKEDEKGKGNKKKVETSLAEKKLSPENEITVFQKQKPRKNEKSQKNESKDEDINEGEWIQVPHREKVKPSAILKKRKPYIKPVSHEINQNGVDDTFSEPKIIIYPQPLIMETKNAEISQRIVQPKIEIETFNIDLFKRKYQEFRESLRGDMELSLGKDTYMPKINYRKVLETYTQQFKNLLKAMLIEFEKANPLLDGKKAEDIITFVALGSVGNGFMTKDSDFEFVAFVDTLDMNLIGWISKYTKSLKEIGIFMDKENLYPSIFSEEFNTTKNIVIDGTPWAIGTSKMFVMYPEIIKERDSRLGINPGTVYKMMKKS